MHSVEQHPYVEQVVTVLPGDSAVGQALGEDPTLDFLENELMKVGSLAHAGIDWDRIESESLLVLAERSKDLKVFSALMLCLQRGGSGDRFSLSLYLLTRVLASWWRDAWPFPGEQGRRARSLLFNQILQRAGRAASSLSFATDVAAERSYCLALLDQVRVAAGVEGLSTDRVTELHRSIARLPAGTDGIAPGSRVGAADIKSSPEAGSAADRSGLGSLTLDAENERATRQSLLKVAALLTEQAPGEPLGYQLRRYAIWCGIATAPPAQDGIKTELAAVSADRVVTYREALALQPDHNLWQRIEQSLTVSPFWLEGHWYSAQVAQALGLTACADAIRRSLQTFVERLPTLTSLTFSDGTPFIPGAVAEWIWGAPDNRDNGSVGDPWNQAYEAACDLLEHDGLGAAMQGLEEGLAAAREPRARFYWRLVSADLLRLGGMTTLAELQLQDLRKQAGDITLAHWEPGLIVRLERNR
ncbi:type VI secretion system protein TssA [Marinobacter sp. X15-166B]|uniref:type VI secretion system protein TssA n=1 Tax=Marinobacter sp. X15-166B TaxID=1897620 RepID=UPI00085C2282|nr:type VI secretion system protein TssA [Marinobacter sp. X15-166B]OEY65822.1 type VI secretion system ImpA domain-containing protein [Marinobacter sp. X15-166B]